MANTPTISVLLNIPAPLVEMIETRMKSEQAAKKPCDFTRVTRTSTILGLLYEALQTSPAAIESASKPKRIAKY